MTFGCDIPVTAGLICWVILRPKTKKIQKSKKSKKIREFFTGNFLRIFFQRLFSLFLPSLFFPIKPPQKIISFAFSCFFLDSGPTAISFFAWNFSSAMFLFLSWYFPSAMNTFPFSFFSFLLFQPDHSS